MTWGRIAIFLAVIVGTSLAAHSYMWMRLVRDPNWPQPWRTGLTVAIVLLGVLLPLSMILWRATSSPIATAIVWLGYLWMGASFILLMCLFAGELLNWFTPNSVLAQFDDSRRNFLSRAFAVGAGSVTAALSAYATYEGLRQVPVKHQAVILRKLPKALDGLRIVQLTDMHVGPTIGKAFVQSIVEQVNAIGADIVAITGDLIDGSVQELAEALSPLRDIVSKDGVFFITGNHEYYSGVDEWLNFLPSLGIRTLRNERVEIARDGAAIDLAGIDDSDAHQFGPSHGADLKLALAGRDESRPVVLLAHRPRAFIEAQASGVDLQLSGHTHGGQIWPFGFITRIVEPFILGLHRRGDSQIYVSCGTGYWGPPMRLGAPAEITLIELKTA